MNGGEENDTGSLSDRGLVIFLVVVAAGTLALEIKYLYAWFPGGMTACWIVAAVVLAVYVVTVSRSKLLESVLAVLTVPLVSAVPALVICGPLLPH